MKQVIAILLLGYYVFGTFFLPEGDFSTLADLPGMYRHCKATEDPDMNLFDFVTDHLVDMDCLFDMRDDDPNEKPHTPFPFHHTTIQTNLVTQQYRIVSATPVACQHQIPAYQEAFYFSDYTSSIFRPPIA